MGRGHEGRELALVLLQLGRGGCTGSDSGPMSRFTHSRPLGGLAILVPWTIRVGPGGGGRKMPVEPVVVITGAGSGLGRSLAISLASKGHGLALVGRSKERLLQTQADIANADCLILPVDVTEEGESEYSVNETLDAFHRIDAVVNNAGMARMATIEQLELAEAEAMLRTN